MDELRHSAENGEFLYKYTRNLLHGSTYQHMLLSDGTLLTSTGEILGKDSAVGEKVGKIIRENEDLENLEAYGDTLGIEFIRGAAIITSINNQILETIIGGDFNSTLKRVSNYRFS